MDGGTIAALVGSGVSLTGIITLYLSTRGKTQSDSRGAQDARLDKRIESYTDKLETRVERAEKEAEEQRGEIAHLQEQQEELLNYQRASNRRESLLFQYVSALRNHIVNELPPPPPTVPYELKEWYDSLEDTLPPVVRNVTEINPNG